ncbi:uncharacterized protein BDR25DRAFT_66396 [Lindgomyces ingoldianus]|uniref:Uncharacterized protein n=1 Tax=Lindgomyces ingoldianus TaxID=673940 RepID=A0ACB6RB30_9PLEO|nr:uncharacterized protein BDR25DRAFT_66396 [Lindgomyces ingoldianus]KAF2476488.1 hypothetical protein BDR25DRAFT_66396 [Lindgomyces ingoldianus]
MTAVAPPPNFQNIARQGWSGSNGVANGVNPMGDNDFRMFMPRKNAQRSTSSSSLSSSASSSTTIPAPSAQTNGVGPSPAGEGSTWAARKKAPRGLWPASKTEPISGISTARPQSIASAGPGPSAASSISALHSPAAMVPSQHSGQSQSQQNGAPRPQHQESSAILHLIPMNGTFERKTITVPFFPDVLRIGRQTNNKTIPTPLNGYFDSKVLSRQHAEIWADRNGKIWIRDVKSSNGTFVNGQRLSQENRDSDPHELREQDMLELGIDIVSEDQKTIVHHKVAARVEHAGIYSNTGNNMLDLNFGEIENQQLSNMMGPGGQSQMANMRGRAPSQGSMTGGRMQGSAGTMGNNANAMQQQQQQRHTNFWLQPITMEQVVKKLNAEIKTARQQSHELQQTHHYINSILSMDPKKEAAKPSPNNHVKVSPIKDLKTRFSEPPAPPPQQPLPEKPNTHQPSLRRSDTERPKSTSSPVRSDSHSQISSLAQELTSAKKEIESQSARLRNLETLLSEERRAREDAEERAKRFERESPRDREVAEPTLAQVIEETPEPESGTQPERAEGTGLENGSASPSIADIATSRLQQRLESMVSEMNEMKQQMENYRIRAETAEAESATHRKTLAEMVEKIRQDDAKRATKEAKRRSQSDSDPGLESTSSRMDGPDEADNSEEGEITIINEKDIDEDGAGALLRRVAQNGEPGSSQDPASAGLVKATHALATQLPNRTDTLTASGPVVSLFTVVALGVAVMAWLNAYPKVER